MMELQEMCNELKAAIRDGFIKHPRDCDDFNFCPFCGRKIIPPRSDWGQWMEEVKPTGGAQ